MPECTFSPIAYSSLRLPAPVVSAFEMAGFQQNTMSKIIKSTGSALSSDGAALAVEAETFLAPRPPLNGKIIGLDCHPDTFTAAVFVGQTPHDARKLACRENLSLDAMLEWAQSEFGPADLFLLEAGSNSFEVCVRLQARGLRAVVLESAHVGKHAKTYADNDKLAAARIALVFLAGNAPCVWVPDALTRERRELLHAYLKTVGEHTAAGNGLKGFLNGEGVRPGKRSLALASTRAWVEKQREWSLLQKKLLRNHYAALDQSAARRRDLTLLVAQEVSAEGKMLRCLKLLGIGMINAFALIAIIGDVKRFSRPEKLVAYMGLNPGQRKSGKSKNVQLGIGQRGRGDMRSLLIQGAHALLRKGKATPLGEWGWKLFARKGERNVAVCAIARKLVVQVWHLLNGNPPTGFDTERSYTIKLKKLAVVIGAKLRTTLGLGESVAECIQTFKHRVEQSEGKPARESGGQEPI